MSAIALLGFTALAYIIFSKQFSISKLGSDILSYSVGKSPRYALEMSFIKLVFGSFIIFVVVSLVANVLVKMTIGLGDPVQINPQIAFTSRLPFLFGMNLFEELLFRWIPIKLLSKNAKGATWIVHLSGLIFIAGHVVFNYHSPALLDILRVLPVWVGHYVFSYICVRKGMTASFISHFLFDVILIFCLFFGV